MSEYTKPTTAEEFERNFAQKNPLMSPTEAYYESARCLFCYDAPCIKACPTGIDIPLFIKQIHTGNMTGSARTIYSTNWLGNACGKVCPTSELCEGACVYNAQNVAPIQIGRLQNFATQTAMDDETRLFIKGASNKRKIAVIGAGPAGIACACELRVMGYEVDIFEAKAKPSGLVVYGTAPYKITNREALQEVEYLQDQLGFRIHYNTAISNVEKLKQLEAIYDAVFLGIGIGGTASLAIPGEDNQNVIGAVEFIENLRMQKHEVHIPARVIVIGGGNTAMDAASEAARMGAKEVVIAYRRRIQDMGAYDFEYEGAKKAGAQGLFNVSPVAILGDEKVVGVRFIKTEIKQGKLEYLQGSEFEVPCDMVILATGQSKQKGFLNMIDHLELDDRGRVIVNDTFQTTNEKYFAGGDAINGGAEVVNAAHDGKAAALGMHKWLNSKNENNG